MLQGCRLFKRNQNLPAKHGVEGVKATEAVLEPTCRALCCRGAGCLRGVRTYLQSTVCRGAGCFRGCIFLPAGRCVAGVQDCLRGVGIYLLGTLLLVCRLLKWCRKLPAGHCVAEVQAVSAVSEPTCWALCCMGAICLSGVGNLPGTVLQGCRLVKQCQNLPARHCVEDCMLFKRCQNLPAGHCVAGVQPF